MIFVIETLSLRISYCLISLQMHQSRLLTLDCQQYSMMKRKETFKWLQRQELPIISHQRFFQDNMINYVIFGRQVSYCIFFLQEFLRLMEGQMLRLWQLLRREYSMLAFQHSMECQRKWKICSIRCSANLMLDWTLNKCCNILGFYILRFLIQH